MSLRVKDLDLERGFLTVRGGKGDRDRVTIVPDSLKETLTNQLAQARLLWEKDHSEGVPGVALRGSLARRFSKAGESRALMWAFPGAQLSNDPLSKIRRRHHLHDKAYSGAIKRAAEKAGIANVSPATPFPTASPPTFSTVEPTSAPFRNSSAMRMSPLRNREPRDGQER